MYPVSEKYKTAIRDSTRNFYYSGEIVTKAGLHYPFTNDDIVKGSGYITNQCCGDSEIEIGTVYAAELGITLYSTIDRYTLEDAIITISFFLQLEDDTYEEVPLGVFEISEANRTINCLAIKAYDYMLRFDEELTDVVTSGTAYQMLSLACEACEVELAHTEDEITQWNNGNLVLGVYAENDIETWRDLLYYVAQVLGCFCTINRKGKLELRKYGNASVEDVSNKHRFSSSFSDFVTRYTAINSTNNQTKTAEYYALDPDDGLTMNLGVNPLLQFGLLETRKSLLTNILNDISVIKYVPFDSSTIGNPAFDLGDVITFSGGHADENQITCITKFEFRINGKHTLKCIGKNPRLASAKSKNDKNIAGLLNQVEAGKIAVHTYMNASPYTIGSSDTEVASIEFASNEDTDAEFHASILLEVTADAVVMSGTAERVVEDETESFSLSWNGDGKAVLTVTYIINDHKLTTYMPVQSLHSGKHILNLYYPLSGLVANTYNTFRVWIRMESGSATVKRGQAIATVSGQGLSSNNVWDGRLEFSEEISDTLLSQGIEVISLSDDVEFYNQIPSPIGIAQTMGVFSIGGYRTCSFMEELSVNPVIVTETIDVTDHEEMEYNTYFVNTETAFEFETTYTFKSQEYPIDEGRMLKLITNTEQYVRIDGLEVAKDG